MTARADSTRHPFHREVLTDLNTLLDNVAAAAPASLDEVTDLPTPWEPPASSTLTRSTPPSGVATNRSANPVPLGQVGMRLAV